MKIAVLVDLEFSEKAGGHVKYWLRISEIVKLKKNIDLTIFFLGKKNEEIIISDNVRFILTKPILPSNILKFLGVDADTTDLFPLNFKLMFKLRKFDLIHTTDQFFSMSRVAKLAAEIWKIPITTSIHTDTPPYTKYYVEKILVRIIPKISGFHRFLINRLKIPDFFQNRMYKKMYNYISKVNHAMVGEKVYSPEFLKKKTGNKNITKLNRGINKDIFFIRKEERDSLLKKLNVPLKDKIIFFSGRIHELKGAIHLASIHKELTKLGFAVTTLVAGEGVHSKKCINIAGKKFLILGYINQYEMAKFYRLCDLFVFPSEYEIGPNVVIEAKACGAVCVVSPGGGGKRIERSYFDGVIVDDLSVSEWVKTISDLFLNKNKIIKIKNFLKKQQIFSWYKVFNLNILPYWKRLKK